MPSSRKTFLLVFAAIISLLSLPVTWMTLHLATSTVGAMTLRYGSFPVTGLSGTVNFYLLSMPLWIVAIVPAAAAVSQLLSKSFPLQIVLALIGVTWMFGALGVALSTGKVTLGFGALMGIVAAVIPCYVLFGSQLSAQQVSSPSPNVNQPQKSI